MFKRVALYMLLGFGLFLALVVAGTRGGVAVGVVEIDRRFLEERSSPEKPINLTVIGIAEVAPDISPVMLAQHVGALRVVGILQASPEIRESLSGNVTVMGTILESHD